MVQICLGGLAPQFNSMRTAILAREKLPHFSTSGKGATHQRVKCSTPSRMIEEISSVEIEANSNRAVMAGRLKSVTPTNGNRTGMVPESLAEGGVITPDHPSVTTHPNAGTTENTATMKRSARKRHETRLQLADS